MRTFIANHRPTIHTIEPRRLGNQSVIMAFCYSVGTVFAHSATGLMVVAFGYSISAVVNYIRDGE